MTACLPLERRSNEPRLRTSFSTPNLSSHIFADRMNTKSHFPQSILLCSALESSPSLSNSSLSGSSASPSAPPLKIQFAPLPTVTRSGRRRHTRPSGVANRQALLRQSHGGRVRVVKNPPGPPLEEGVQSGGALRQEEEAIDVIAEMFKEVGRSIWRRMVKTSARSLPEPGSPKLAGEGMGATKLDSIDADKQAMRTKALLIDKVVQYTLKEEGEGEWDEDLKQSLPPLPAQVTTEIRVVESKPLDNKGQLEDGDDGALPAELDGAHAPS